MRGLSQHREWRKQHRGRGSTNAASGDYSFAAGHRAKALGNGSFSFADSNNFDFSSNTDNAFRVDSSPTSTEPARPPGRNQKQDLRQLDGRAVLGLVKMPVFEWYPKGRNAHVRHYGPTAQDFHAAFGLGDDDTMIGAGCRRRALAAIQGLNAKVEAQAREIAELRRAVELLARRE